MVNVIWKLGLPSLTVWEDIVEVRFDMLLMCLQLLMINCKYLHYWVYLCKCSQRCFFASIHSVTHEEESDNETDDSESTDGGGPETPRDVPTPRGTETPLTTPRRLSVSDNPRRSSSADTLTAPVIAPEPVPRRSASFSEAQSQLDVDQLKLEAEQKIASLTAGLAQVAIDEQQSWESKPPAVASPGISVFPADLPPPLPPALPLQVLPPPAVDEHALPPPPVSPHTPPPAPTTKPELPTSLPTTCFADGDDFGDVIDLALVHSYQELEEQMLEKFPDNKGKKLLIYFVDDGGKKVKITPANFNQSLLLSGVVREVRIRGN